MGSRARDLEGAQGELGRGEGVLGAFEGVPGILSPGGSVHVRPAVRGKAHNLLVTDKRQRGLMTNTELGVVLLFSKSSGYITMHYTCTPRTV